MKGTLTMSRSTVYIRFTLSAKARTHSYVLGTQVINEDEPEVLPTVAESLHEALCKAIHENDPSAQEWLQSFVDDISSMEEELHDVSNLTSYDAVLQAIKALLPDPARHTVFVEMFRQVLIRAQAEFRNTQIGTGDDAFIDGTGDAFIESALETKSAPE